MKSQTEGNKFTGELAKAKAAGKDEFEVDGKTHKVEEADKPDFADSDGKTDVASKKKSSYSRVTQRTAE
jgi:hypothetical protein